MIGIVLSVVIGIVLGIFYRVDTLIYYANPLSSIGLCLLLFFVGVDIGYNKDVMTHLRMMSKKVFLLPAVGIVGSLVGGALAATVLSLNVKECVTVAAGLGWYSFSAIEVGKVSAYLGGVTFLANVFRELFAIIFVPVIAKKIGPYESVITGGATAMDSVLPIINKSNPPRISIVGFYSGLVMSIVVPILVPAVIKIFNL